MVAAVVSAAAFACRPQAGIGSIALARRGALHVIDMATCRDRVLVSHGVQAPIRFVDGGREIEYAKQWVVSVKGGTPHRLAAVDTGVVSPDGGWSAVVLATGRGKTAKQSIWVTNRRTGKSRRVYALAEYSPVVTASAGPLWLLGWSRDDRWVFFMIDPDSSASIAADGLLLRVVPAAGALAHRVAFMLTYPDYLSWCGARLVLSAGVDRIATDRKALLTTGPPGWQTQPLVRAPSRSWGALACAPDQSYLVAQAQPSSVKADFFATHWALWRVSLTTAAKRLTGPPSGYADESPRFSRDGRTLLFIRSRQGVGKLYLIRAGKLVGPLLSLGYQLGYYGHQDWWQTADWSDASPG